MNLNLNRISVLVLIVMLAVIVLALIAAPADAQSEVSICVVPGLYGDVTFVISGLPAEIGYGTGGDGFASAALYPDGTFQGSAAEGEILVFSWMTETDVYTLFLGNDGSWPECGNDDADANGPDGSTKVLQESAAGRAECLWQVEDEYGNWNDVATTVPVDKDGELVCELTVQKGDDRPYRRQ